MDSVQLTEELCDRDVMSCGRMDSAHGSFSTPFVSRKQDASFGSESPADSQLGHSPALCRSSFSSFLVDTPTPYSAVSRGFSFCSCCESNSLEFASMTPLLAISILFDSAQGVLSGVSRGCGWQHLAAWTNLAAFYIIGMPVAILLAFKLELCAKGLWIGLICGLFCQACTLLLITSRTKWASLELSVDKKQVHHTGLSRRQMFGVWNKFSNKHLG